VNSSVHTLTQPIPGKTPLGFIGTGIMGTPMILNLLHQGYPVWVFNRTSSRAREVISAGAEFRSLKEITSQCKTIFTLVGLPTDVHTLYNGPQGILAQVQAQSLLIDFTTSKPGLAAKIQESAQKKNCNFLDAPVSGGEQGAKEAKLCIVVGGPTDSFNAALPLLKILGSEIHHMGSSGMGLYTKLCNQIALASQMLGLCESLAFAEKIGLNTAQVLEALKNGTASSWALRNLGQKMLTRDYTPGFFVKYFIKDLDIALDCADELGCHFPGLELAQKMYQILKEEGGGDQGTQALYRIIKNFAL